MLSLLLCFLSLFHLLLVDIIFLGTLTINEMRDRTECKQFTVMSMNKSIWKLASNASILLNLIGHRFSVSLFLSFYALYEFFDKFEMYP